MPKIPFNLKTHSRLLRKNQTEPEHLLWRFLRARRFYQFHFKRQQVIGFYIVDFYCSKAKLIIELDGCQHASKEGVLYDQERSAYLSACGLRVIRFWNNEVRNNISGVLKKIRESL